MKRSRPSIPVPPLFLQTPSRPKLRSPILFSLDHRRIGKRNWNGLAEYVTDKLKKRHRQCRGDARKQRLRRRSGQGKTEAKAQVKSWQIKAFSRNCGGDAYQQMNNCEGILLNRV